ncbi:MAG: hypothetical protein KGD58_16365 [Candidatus Lokiarchaeota archaeon]|nr:hypothetical protein [Candidatus Lokiarchaeota archaeon]
MEVKEDFNTKTNNSQITLFGFELNRSQTVLFLILSVIGIFMLPLMLAIEIFTNLFKAIFFDVPNYLHIIEHFPIYRQELWFFYIFSPIITRIFVASILLYLSIHALNKILKPAKIENEGKQRVIQKDRIVKWFGFKLTHGQSLFIYSLSLAGILYTVQFFFDSSYSPDFMLNFENYCKIGEVSNRSLSFITSIIISTLFISLCLYSLVVIRKRKFALTPKKTVKNHGLIIFIIFLAIFLFFIMRILCHIILFTDVAYIFGITPAITNSYQSMDFIRTVLILIVSTFVITTSYFMTRKTHKQSKMNHELIWLRIDLTPNRAIILLSLTILSIIFFSYTSLTIIFTVGLYFYTSSLSFVFIPIILLCYYSINKILKENRIKNILDSIERSEELLIKWFKLQLKKLDSIVFLSISSGVILIYFLYLIGINTFLSEMISRIDYSTMYIHEIVGFLLVMTVLILMLAIAIYTIKNTLPSIKSHE